MPPAPAAEERLGLSLYAPDVAALHAIVAELRRLGHRVSGRVALKALLHASSADELHALAAARAQARAAGPLPGEDAIAEHYGFPVLVPDIAKLDQVNDRLVDQRLRAGRTFIIRSRLHGPIDYPTLAKAVAKLLKLKPDGRSRAGRRLAGRD